jgi:hypothetical protein
MTFCGHFWVILEPFFDILTFLDIFCLPPIPQCAKHVFLNPTKPNQPTILGSKIAKKMDKKELKFSTNSEKF